MFARTGWPTCGGRTPEFSPTNFASGPRTPSSRPSRELGDSFQIIDLRLAKPGDGFSWGRYGPRTQIKRFGTHAVFAYEKPKSVISRLFGL
jgi:hypothetical protein